MRDPPHSRGRAAAVRSSGRWVLRSLLHRERDGWVPFFAITNHVTEIEPITRLYKGCCASPAAVEIS
jgi:hypothetical protein